VTGSFCLSEENMRDMTLPVMLPRQWLLSIAAAALSVGAAAVFATAVSASGRLGQNANIPLITQDGQTVHFYDDLIKGKIVAVNFIYTSCLFSCPLETARLAQVQRMLGDRVGKDIFFYSISIDPDHDTPAVLKDYMQEFDVGPGWTFLTGNSADIDLLAVRLGLTGDPSITSGPGRDVDGHTPHLLIGNETTGVWLRDSSADNPSMLAHLLVTFVGGGAVARSANPSHADGAPLRLNTGQYLFAKECAACHTVNGQGGTVGPDLKNVTRVRDRDWLERYITAPNKMRAAGDPIALVLAASYKVVMPNLSVGDRDLEAIMAFLSAQAGPQQSGSQ
jgi:protein SCO1/2